jgi:hypothetical protein
MAVTYEETTSNGTQTDFNIIFPFLDRSHVEVRFGGVAQPTTAYSFLSDSQVRLTVPAATSVLVRVARNTPKTVQTDFVGGILPESDLDGGYLHSLYMVQELQDLWEETVAGAVTPAAAIQNNLSATVSPSVTDDSDAGYSVSSTWFNTNKGRLWICTDVTVGAAVWAAIELKHFSSSGDTPQPTNDVTEGYSVGSVANVEGTGIFFCSDASEGFAIWTQFNPTLVYPLSHLGIVNIKQGTGISSSSSLDPATSDGNWIVVSGSTGPITDLGTDQQGGIFHFEFTGTPTLQHHATKLDLFKSSNIVVEAGDIATFLVKGSQQAKLLNYVRKKGGPIFPRPGGIVQVIETQTGAVATTTTVIPADDTIPQNTEGAEVITLAITPSNASNLLVIEVVLIAEHASNCVFATLFQDTTADALAAAASGGHATAAGSGSQIVLRHAMTAGTTSATTFKVRGGSQTAGTVTFNGYGSGRIFGGVYATSIKITEYEV